MASGEIKKGNKRLQLSITEEADNLLRQHAPRQGDKSQIVNNLIIEKYQVVAENANP